MNRTCSDTIHEVTYSDIYEPPTANVHALLIAGGGAWALSSTVLWRLMAQELQQHDIPFTPVDGLYTNAGELIVKPASKQYEEAQAFINQLPAGTDILLFTQCLGSVAALNLLESADPDRNTVLGVISPPLPTPAATLQQPKSQVKRSERDRIMHVSYFANNSFDFADLINGQARIDPSYLEENRAAATLEKRLRHAVETATAAVFATEYDWNTGSPPTVQAWRNDWAATLHPRETDPLASRAIILPSTAHSLNRSDSIKLPREEQLMFQQANVQQVLKRTLRLLKDTPACTTFEQHTQPNIKPLPIPTTMR